ncbi:hypothetical protein [Ferruginibacter profundus]
MTKNTKPPYLLGLLGLIPLVGAFVGIALILYGIIRYKDKWLIAVGAGCIIFTIIIYSSLFSLFKNPKVRNGFADISQKSLNSLCRNIEFYKLEHGSYPDSLPQLLSDVTFAPINDPVAVWGSKNSYYNYKNLGDKYLVFSSGIDGIENTKDDIYPTIDSAGSKLKFAFMPKHK